MADLLFVGQFIASKAGKTGLTVTVDVDRYTLADGSRTALVTAGSATEGRRGLYHYRLASADLATYQYVATFITADATVDQQEIAALGIVVPDARVGSRLAPATAGRTLAVDASGNAAANVTYWAGQATSHTDGTPDTNLKWINGVQLASTSSEGYLPAEIDAFSEVAIRTAIGLATANMDTQLAAVAKTGADGDTLETLSDQIDGTATASALATVDGIVDALALVAPDNKPTVAATGEAFANVTKQAGVAVAAADANGNVPVDVKLWKGVTINDLVDGNVVVKLADVAHGGSAATLNLKKLSLINPTDNDPALYLEAKHTPVVQSYALLTVLGRYGWEISDGMAVALYPALVTEETLRSNLRIVTGALSDPVGMTATVDQDLYGTDAYVGWMLFLEYHDRGLNRWAAKVVSHTATTITLDDTIPGAGTFWLLPATGLSAQQTRDAMKLAPSAGAPAAGSVDAHLDALALEATAQAILEDTGTTLPTAIAVVDANVDLLLAMDTSTTDATTAGAISRRRGNSWSIPLTIGAITGYTSLWFTIKSSHDDADASALLQIKLNASGLSEGLLYVK